ncbi:MAG TPA: 30S ribosomal protein S20, partial [bacterium]|nr:30S ribosomal protein S20 [bacterium]
SQKHNAHNRALKAEINTWTKKVVTSSKEEAPALLKTLQSKLDKAGRKGVIHHKNAAHKVSKVMRALAGK